MKNNQSKNNNNQLTFMLTLLLSFLTPYGIFAQNVNSTTATTNYVPVWSIGSPSYTLSNSQIQDNGTGIGIGTSPGSGVMLNINGDVNTTSDYRIANIPFIIGDLPNFNIYLGDNISGATDKWNTIIGSYAGNSNVSQKNTIVGSYSCFLSTGISCYQNTAVGCSTLYHSIAYGGSFLGCLAGYNNTIGCGITAIGENALFSNTTGNYNCAIGHRSGISNVIGDSNTYIGNQADAGQDGLFNSSAIGNNSIIENSNEMVLGDNNVYVGVGYSGITTYPPGKLSVDEDAGTITQPTITGYFHNEDITTEDFSFDKKAVFGICDGYSAKSDGGMVNLGGDFSAQESSYLNIAVRGRTGIYKLNKTFGDYAFGGFFEAKNSYYQNIGVYGYTNAIGSNINYGVYGNTASNVCGTTGCVSAAAFFNGDVYCTTNNYYPSDATFKDNIQPLSNNLNVIKSLNPKSFTFRNSQFPNINLPRGTQSGLIAQDVQNILPNLIGHFKVPGQIDSLGVMDTTGTSATYLAINYAGLIPYLIGAVKEESHTVDSLNNLIDTLRIHDSINTSRINQLAQLINPCCNNNGGSSRMASPSINVELSNSIILNQNDPNPFAEETKISYSIPSSVSDAKIIFFDNSGHILQTVKIEERGAGQLVVYASNLTSGIYSYSLIADGNVIDTKKMVCNK